MVQSRVLKLALFPAAIVLAVITAYRVGATTTARPVVRQQFVRRLDPATPDFLVGAPRIQPTGSNSSWKVNTNAFAEPWTTISYDDSTWPDATVHGGGGYFGTSSIWAANENESHVALRFEFDWPAAGDCDISLGVDEDFRLYANGTLVAESALGHCCASGRFDLSQFVQAGRNVVAIEGINGDGPGSCSALLTDHDFDPVNPLTLTAWAVFSVPSVNPRSEVTAQAQLVSTDPDADAFPRLQGMRVLSPPLSLKLRPGELLVQLTTGIHDGEQPLLQPGLYRLIVDTVAP
jgi:hypothetical protein